jgi:hypothetical protein
MSNFDNAKNSNNLICFEFDARFTIIVTLWVHVTTHYSMISYVIRRVATANITCRFTCALMYYGLSLNTGSLPGDIYVNVIISGAVEVPALIIGFRLMNWERTGRRISGFAEFLVAGVSSFLCIPMILFGKSISYFYNRK